MSHLKIRDTDLSDTSLDNIHKFAEQELNKQPYVPFVIVSLAIIAFNFVILCIALVTIGTKGYDPYIHASSMFISVVTLGCICAIHKYILGE